MFDRVGRVRWTEAEVEIERFDQLIVEKVTFDHSERFHFATTDFEADSRGKESVRAIGEGSKGESSK